MTNVTKEDMSVDWEKVKDFICSLSEALQVVVEQLPKGLIKTILLGVITLLNLACNNI